MTNYFTFTTLQAAIDYRYKNGLGGWIFAPENDKPSFYPFHEVILFPSTFTPSDIFNHPFTKGRSGKLIAGN
jgi:hypothetical protein